MIGSYIAVEKWIKALGVFMSRKQLSFIIENWGEHNQHNFFGEIFIENLYAPWRLNMVYCE